MCGLRGCYLIIQLMENQVEKKMENEVDTVHIYIYVDIFIQICVPRTMILFSLLPTLPVLQPWVPLLLALSNPNYPKMN